MADFPIHISLSPYILKLIILKKLINLLLQTFCLFNKTFYFLNTVSALNFTLYILKITS